MLRTIKIVSRALAGRIFPLSPVPLDQICEIFGGEWYQSARPHGTFIPNARGLVLRDYFGTGHWDLIRYERTHRKSSHERLHTDLTIEDALVEMYIERGRILDDNARVRLRNEDQGLSEYHNYDFRWSPPIGAWLVPQASRDAYRSRRSGVGAGDVAFATMSQTIDGYSLIPSMHRDTTYADTATRTGSRDTLADTAHTLRPDMINVVDLHKRLLDGERFPPPSTEARRKATPLLPTLNVITL